MLDELIKYASDEGRVCPLPNRWNELWQMLPERRRINDGWEPPLPLILAAWGSPGLLKIIRLREHIEWAASHGALVQVDAFLRGLPEDEWFHLGR